MTTRLPPPPDPLPLRRPGEELVVAEGSAFGRVYFAGGAHPATWRSFRPFGPVATMRFDHHPPPARDHPDRAISYLGPTRGRRGRRFDPFATCLRECFASTGVIDARSGAPRFVVWPTRRDVRLMDVADSPWIVRAGGNAAISSGARGMSRRWSRAIYAAYADLDGLWYESSTLPGSRSVALYERARSALPARPALDLALPDPLLHDALRRIAWRYDMDLLL